MARILGDKVPFDRTAIARFFERCQTFPAVPIAGPKTLKERYITEDVPYGLVPISQLAEKLGSKATLMNTIIDLASTLNDEDYRKTGRTLSTLGLDKMTKEQIMKYVEEGV